MDICLDGRRVRKIIPGARTRTEAQAALAAVKADILRGQFNFKTEKKILFEDFAELYLDRHSRPNKRSWRRDIVSLHALTPRFRGLPLSKITPFSIEGYKLKRKEEVEISTVNRELGLLKNMFTKAIDWGFASENPVKRVKFFNEENRKRSRTLTQDEVNSLLENSRTPLKETILIALNTGMRIGEIMALRWEDVHFEEGYLFIRDSKSGRSRKVPINRVATDALLILQKRAKGRDFVFPNHSTGTFTKYPRKAFLSACERAGIEGLWIHDLRHQAASNLVQAGVDLHTVSKILGHSTIKLTERYSHPGFDHTKDAVAALERFFDKKPGSQKKSGTNMAQTKIMEAVTRVNTMTSDQGRAVS